MDKYGKMLLTVIAVSLSLLALKFVVLPCFQLKNVYAETNEPSLTSQYIYMKDIPNNVSLFKIENDELIFLGYSEAGIMNELRDWHSATR